MEAILTTPFPVFAMASWVLAITMLVRSWWRRTKLEWSTMDGPERLLAIVVRLLPTVRTAWGTAMMAELAHLRTPSSRWRFALGCVRVALLPPRSSRLPVAIVGTLAAVAAISALVVLGLVLPAVQVFGASFIALVGILATVAVGRSRGPNLATPGLTVTVAMLAGVAGCIAIFAYIGMHYPAAACSSSPCTRLHP